MIVKEIWFENGANQKAGIITAWQGSGTGDRYSVGVPVRPSGQVQQAHSGAHVESPGVMWSTSRCYSVARTSTESAPDPGHWAVGHSRP